MTQPRTFTGTDPSGRDVMVTVWGDGTADLAYRDDSRSWLPPIQLTEES